MVRTKKTKPRRKTSVIGQNSMPGSRGQTEKRKFEAGEEEPDSKRRLVGENTSNMAEIVQPHTSGTSVDGGQQPLTLSSVVDILRKDMASMKSAMSETLTTFEDTITKKVVDEVTEKLAKSIDASVERVVAEKLKVVREDLDARMKELDDKLIAVQATAHQPDERGGIALNIVIRGLKEEVGEDATAKVCKLIRDELKEDIAVQNAERHKSFRQGTPGVIVAKCRSAEDKTRIMKAKSKLRQSRSHKNVHIDSDKPRDQRIQEANMRTLAQVLGPNKLKVHGGRLVRSQDGPGQGQRNNNGNNARRRTASGEA